MVKWWRYPKHYKFAIRDGELWFSPKNNVFLWGIGGLPWSRIEFQIIFIIFLHMKIDHNYKNSIGWSNGEYILDTTNVQRGIGEQCFSPKHNVVFCGAGGLSLLDW